MLSKPRAASRKYRSEGPRDAVIFDLDGVLVDSFDVMRQAFLIAYRETVGDGPAPFEEYNRHLGRYFPDIMQIMGLPAEMEEPFVRESHRLAARIQLFDGVRETLAALRARGIGMAIATGKSGPRARALLERLGVLSEFGYVIGGDEVARAKPAPDIVLRAIDLLGVTPERAMMIGDAATDIASARGAGVLAVAATWGAHDVAALMGTDPDVVVDRPAQILGLTARVAA